MTITYTIPGATQLNQLADPTIDGLPDENANDNCVPASIAEALHILTGKTFDADQLKDAVFGQGWTGFQSASRYIAYCAGQGVALSPHNDTQAGLIATIHAEVSAGRPVLVTMPSQWGTAPTDPVHPSGSTHVGVMVGEGPGELRCMNPWGGFWQDQPDAWWQARLCYGQVWPMAKAASTTGGNTTMLDVSQTGGMFVANADGSWTCPTTGKSVAGSILNFYRSLPFNLAGLFALGLPIAEMQHPSAQVWLQLFERGALVCDPAYTYDRPPGVTGDTYFAHIDQGLANEALTAAAVQAATAPLASQLSAAQGNLTAAQQQRDALSAQLATAQSSLSDAQEQIATLTQQLAAAQQQQPPSALDQAAAALAPALKAFLAAAS